MLVTTFKNNFLLNFKMEDCYNCFVTNFTKAVGYMKIVMDVAFVVNVILSLTAPHWSTLVRKQPICGYV